MAQYSGSLGNDYLSGSQFDDVFYGGGGNDTLNGQDGTDTVVLSGSRADYDIAVVSAGGLTDYFLYDLRNGQSDGIIETRNIEQFQFSSGLSNSNTLHATPYSGTPVGPRNLVLNGDFSRESETSLSIDYISDYNANFPSTPYIYESAGIYGIFGWNTDGYDYISTFAPGKADPVARFGMDLGLDFAFISGATLSQVITNLTSGATYDLSFSAPGGRGVMEVLWDGALIDAQQTTYSATHLTVTAKGGGDTLEFWWTGEDGGVGNIQDVRLLAAGPAATADFSAKTGAVIANLSDDPFHAASGAMVSPLRAFSLAGGSQALNNVHTALGGSGADALVGSSASDTLYGGGGNDTLYGGSGAGLLSGGAGNDVYYVSSAKDVIAEAAGGGFDTVHTTLATYALPANVEALHYNGTGAFNGTGGAGGDVLYADGASAATLHGAAGDDTLYGGAGADSLYGEGGRDQIFGGGGSDYIRSLTGEGPDTINGGGGLDLLTLERTDAIQNLHVDLTLVGNQAVGEGTVFQQIEQIRLAAGSGGDYARGGNYDDVLKGNGGADTLIGSGGNDVLQGGPGHDSLTGGTGADTFRFDGPIAGSDDTITDFGTGVDKIALTATGFGVASPMAFDIVDAGAGPFEHRATLVVDTANHTLSWDADGVGAGSAVLLAHGAFTTAPGDYILF